VGSASRTLNVVDLDQDGWSDLLVTNNRVDNNYSTQTLGFLRNAAGTFQDQITYPTGATPWDVKAVDLNGDGWPDVVLSNHNDISIWVMWNVDGGQLSWPSAFLNTDDGYAVTLGDFNEDGKIDAVIADYNMGMGSFYAGLGAAGFAAVTTFPVADKLVDVAQGDFNEDGHLDVVFSTWTKNVTVSVCFGNGDGTFSSPHSFLNGAVTNWVAVGDFDGDGHQDIAAADYTSGQVDLYLGHGDGSFDPVVLLNTGTTGQPVDSVAFADVDGDGRQEVISTNTQRSRVYLFTSLDDGGILGPIGFPATNASRIAVGDFNNDGAPDIAVVDNDETRVPDEVYILTNQCP
jgi:hypothetical protein